MNLNTGQCVFTDDEESFSSFVESYGEDVKIAIPDEANPNYLITQTASAADYQKRMADAFTVATAQEYDEAYCMAQ